ncbi:MAG: hypothetical protein IT340_04835 [Chloroflexi bacterium]|nr:hypothetical protein [Chloroflexota bacterium]
MAIPTGSYVTAVLTRVVRDLADLGNGSRYLGERWEAVGGRQLAALVGQELRAPSGEVYQCAAVQRLDNHDGLLAEASGRGLKSPDCLFAGRDRLGRLIIQPGDFKFTLDVATRDQIDPAPIRALLERGGPRFQQALGTLLDQAGPYAAADLQAQGLLDALDSGRARLLPGVVLAPDEPSNRLFLRQSARRRNAVGEVDVRFLAVDRTFFDGLPGAEVAPALRALDSMTVAQGGFPAATYYYQLGVAVRGALTLLLRPLLPLLGPEPAIDAVAGLHAWLAERPPMWAIDAARDLAAPASLRRERMRLAQRLSSAGLRGRATYEVIESLGLTLADEPGPRAIAKSELRGVHATIDAAHDSTMPARLAERLAVGPLADDEAVLTWLRALRPTTEQWARDMLAALLTQHVAHWPDPPVTES